LSCCRRIKEEGEKKQKLNKERHQMLVSTNLKSIWYRTALKGNGDEDKGHTRN